MQCKATYRTLIFDLSFAHLQAFHPFFLVSTVFCVITSYVGRTTPLIYTIFFYTFTHLCIYTLVHLHICVFTHQTIKTRGDPSISSEPSFISMNLSVFAHFKTIYLFPGINDFKILSSSKSLSIQDSCPSSIPLKTLIQLYCMPTLIITQHTDISNTSHIVIDTQ